jgi:hypothetical protein
MDNPQPEKGIAMLRKKFEDDKLIQMDKDVDVQAVYDKLKAHVQAQHTNITKENQNVQEIRPSGADIIKLYEELKAEAYFEQVASEEGLQENEILILKKKTVDDYFSNLGMGHKSEEAPS